MVETLVMYLLTGREPRMAGIKPYRTVRLQYVSGYIRYQTMGSGRNYTECHEPLLDTFLTRN